MFSKLQRAIFDNRYYLHKMKWFTKWSNAGMNIIELLKNLFDIVFKGNELKQHSKEKIYDRKFDVLNELEAVVSDLIAATWIFRGGK